ncbi:hypothetical protein [Burkholderia cenocepacia]|uniref:hypothetical protein n=1 Tax=Burkholderia cenocepacia TaxID=95486 RepID=UPI001F4AD1C2|nr:hypothetical protein [Burkholderia cenocepacia]
MNIDYLWKPRHARIRVMTGMPWNDCRHARAARESAQSEIATDRASTSIARDPPAVMTLGRRRLSVVVASHRRRNGQHAARAFASFRLGRSVPHAESDHAQRLLADNAGRDA